jgi:hypothetical protein
MDTPRLHIHRTDIPKAQFWKTKDGRRIAAVYAGDNITGAAVVLVPADASSWEEQTATAIATDRAFRRQSVWELVCGDELPPEPRIVAA